MIQNQIKTSAFLFTLFMSLLFGFNSQASIQDHKQVVGDTQSIKAMGECSKYYWYGTDHGLYFVRKKNNKIFHMTTKNSILPSDRITAITVAPNGEVFIGTSNGLVRYDLFSFLLISTENSSLPSNHITALVVSGNSIYVGTDDKEITLFSGSSSKLLKSDSAVLVNGQILSKK